jgi:hypothetical protein
LAAENLCVGCFVGGWEVDGWPDWEGGFIQGEWAAKGGRYGEEDGSEEDGKAEGGDVWYHGVRSEDTWEPLSSISSNTASSVRRLTSARRFRITCSCRTMLQNISEH